MLQGPTQDFAIDCRMYEPLSVGLLVCDAGDWVHSQSTPRLLPSPELGLSLWLPHDGHTPANASGEVSTSWKIFGPVQELLDLFLPFV